MTDPSFVSYAQHGEDIVLWRALRSVEKGRYVEVGANDPTEDSVSRAFYERGWSGIEIEPVPEFAERFRRERPRDVLVEGVVTEDEGTVVLHMIPGTGLSSVRPEVAARQNAHGWEVTDIQVRSWRLDTILDRELAPDDGIHFLLVDVEGAELGVLRSIDLTRRRPWVLVVEATAPSTSVPTHERWEQLVLDAGYQFCLFDGLSRFYVADEHADLAPKLSYGASPADRATIYRDLKRQDELVALRQRVGHVDEGLRRTEEELVRWRGVAIDGWSELQTHAGAVRSGGGDIASAELRRELEAMRATLSWRITKPIRTVRRLQRGIGSGQ